MIFQRGEAKNLNKQKFTTGNASGASDTAMSEYYSSIGKKGGESLKRQRGREYYSGIAQLGGKACLKNHGREYFQLMGKQGGKTTSERYGPEFYSRIGKLGAQARRQKKKLLTND